MPRQPYETLISASHAEWLNIDGRAVTSLIRAGDPTKPGFVAEGDVLLIRLESGSVHYGAGERRWRITKAVANGVAGWAIAHEIENDDTASVRQYTLFNLGRWPTRAGNTHSSPQSQQAAQALMRNPWKLTRLPFLTQDKRRHNLADARRNQSPFTSSMLW